jgi:hypothetical protein
MLAFLASLFYAISSAAERAGRAVDPRFRHARAKAKRDMAELAAETVIANQRRETFRLLSRMPSDTADFQITTFS